MKLSASARRLPARHLPAAVAAAVAQVALTAGCSTTPDDEHTSPPRPETTSTTDERTSTRLDVEVNHCFVEPVSFDGQLWNVPFEDQFGWGGLEPENWQGSGVMVRLAEDTARFDDDGGAEVVFKPADDPAVRPVERAQCG